jgi:hypothetical protein
LGNKLATETKPAMLLLSKGSALLRLQAVRYTSLKRFTLKRIIIAIPSSILLGLLLSSCSAIIQKAYVATSPNLNCFEREKEKNLKLSLFVNHYEVQSNYVLSKTFGLYAGINGCFTKIFGGEIAGIYYKNFNDKNYFEIQGGYGYFTNQSNILNMAWDLGALIEYGKHFSQNSNTSYHKIYIQPAFFYRLKKVNWGFAIKISANYFDKYHYDYSLKDDSDGDYSATVTYSNSDFHYKWGLSLEPAIRVQFKSKLFLQLSAILTSNINNAPVYYGHYSYGHVINAQVSGQASNPQHIYFVATIGYEIKFGKKK